MTTFASQKSLEYFEFITNKKFKEIPYVSLPRSKKKKVLERAILPDYVKTFYNEVLKNEVNKDTYSMFCQGEIDLLGCRIHRDIHNRFVLDFDNLRKQYYKQIKLNPNELRYAFEGKNEWRKVLYLGTPKTDGNSLEEIQAVFKQEKNKREGIMIADLYLKLIRKNLYLPLADVATIFFGYPHDVDEETEKHYWLQISALFDEVHTKKSGLSVQTAATILKLRPPKARSLKDRVPAKAFSSSAAAAAVDLSEDKKPSASTSTYSKRRLQGNAKLPHRVLGAVPRMKKLLKDPPVVAAAAAAAADLCLKIKNLLPTCQPIPKDTGGFKGMLSSLPMFLGQCQG
jgi:hypothetical protein